MDSSPRSAGGVNNNSGNSKPPGVTATQSGGTVQKRSNKMASGQSLNHLLNFTLPPRQTHALQSIPRRSRKTATGYGVWNKEKFVNAQYRFVMKPSGDYTVHFADPDIFFQWQDILQVIIPRTSALAAAVGRQEEHSEQDEGQTTCPICLSPPSAPRMTKCGHVFCFPCVLHYLNTSDHTKWNRCPICFDSINEKQLKSVKWYDEPTSYDDSIETSQEASSSSSQIELSGDSARPGSTLRMRLMERPQITTLALPRSRTWPSDLIPPHQAPFHFLPDTFRYSRFMLATPTYLLTDLSRDLDELASERRILSGMKDELSVSFVDVAEAKVRGQMEKAAALETEELKEAVARAEQSMRDIERSFEERGRRRMEREQNPELQDVGAVPDAFLATKAHTPKPSSTSRNQRPRRNLNPPPPSTSTYYFYQAASGALIFLHPLDIRILLAHFHSYAEFPDSIAVRVDASSEGSVDGELRRRCKYLAHVPESADVVFVEADLAGVVGPETLRTFEAPLRARRAKRREKGKKDDRARARAEEREREKLRLPAAPMTVPAGLGGDSEFGYVVSPVSEPRPPSPEEIVVEADPPPPSSAPSGAWGQRSFASALGGRARSGQQSRVQREAVEEDEWDMDAAWHELEAGGGGGGGRRKRPNRLVVLGGVGGRKR
ncbi:hypothetical protein DFH11DRAFT_1610856 [Phellopilus nigrolimitatus]|nr:hypothetical protein DFH11DRAFT_1610856 [Phellopilus nigrolimitatus]